MISIILERCTGCGACLEVCPAGALYLVEGKATVEGTLCRECEACLDACPSEAIVLSAQDTDGAEAACLPALRPEPQVIRVKARAAPVPLRARVLPLVGSALVWAEREILPWLADLIAGQRGVRRASRRAVATPRLRAQGAAAGSTGIAGKGKDSPNFPAV